MADRRFGWILACVGVLAVHRAATTVPGSGPDDRRDGDHTARRDHDDAGFVELAVGHVAGLERGDLRHATGPRRFVAGSDRNGGAARADGDHDAGRHVPGAPDQSGSRGDATDSGGTRRCFTAHSSCPRTTTEEGPPDGLTLDQAIDLLDAPEPRPAGQAARNPPGARRCFDSQSARQSAFLCRQPACPVRLRLGAAARWPYTV